MKLSRYGLSSDRLPVSVLVIILVPAVILAGFTVSRVSHAFDEPPRNSRGAVERSRTWYLPAGETGVGFQTWILLDNPDKANARVALDFHSEGRVAGSLTTELAAATMTSINVGDFVSCSGVSTVARSDLPIVAASIVYDTGRGSFDTSAGSTRTSTRWNFPESAAIGSSYETRILLHNPSDRRTVAEVTFRSSGAVVGPFSYDLGPRSRVSIDMGNHVSGFEVATLIESSMPIVAAVSAYGEPVCEDPKARVVAAASAQLGKPYARGAAGPDSFDCSGLAQYCYMLGAGMRIPHGSHAQARCGTPVDTDDLRPGDIVGFHGWGHVGIYIGEGEYIHSPQTGEVVKISPLRDRKDYCGAVRL